MADSEDDEEEYMVRKTAKDLNDKKKNEKPDKYDAKQFGPSEQDVLDQWLGGKH